MAAACIFCGVGVPFSRPEQWLREFRAGKPPLPILMTLA